MASGNTLIVFTPNGAELPASNYATLDVRNNHPCLDFDTTTAETVYFTGVMPQSYSDATGITVYVHWAAASATSGTIGWLVALDRVLLPTALPQIRLSQRSLFPAPLALLM